MPWEAQCCQNVLIFNLRPLILIKPSNVGHLWKKTGVYHFLKSDPNPRPPYFTCLPVSWSVVCTPTIIYVTDLFFWIQAPGNLDAPCKASLHFIVTMFKTTIMMITAKHPTRSGAQKRLSMRLFFPTTLFNKPLQLFDHNTVVNEKRKKIEKKIDT